MGRPSELRARARKQNDVGTTTQIGGDSLQAAVVSYSSDSEFFFAFRL